MSVCEIFGGSDHSVLFVFWKVYLGSSSSFFELVSEMLLDAKENHFPDLCFYLRVTMSPALPLPPYLIHFATSRRLVYAVSSTASEQDGKLSSAWAR